MYAKIQRLFMAFLFCGACEATIAYAAAQPFASERKVTLTVTPTVAFPGDLITVTIDCACGSGQHNLVLYQSLENFQWVPGSHKTGTGNAKYTGNAQAFKGTCTPKDPNETACKPAEDVILWVLRWENIPATPTTTDNPPSIQNELELRQGKTTTTTTKYSIRPQGKTAPRALDFWATGSAAAVVNVKGETKKGTAFTSGVAQVSVEGSHFAKGDETNISSNLSVNHTHSRPWSIGGKFGLGPVQLDLDGNGVSRGNMTGTITGDYQPSVDKNRWDTTMDTTVVVNAPVNVPAGATDTSMTVVTTYTRHFKRSDIDNTANGAAGTGAPVTYALP